ncbi:MAG: DUF1559 domain-containing protein [Pirellulaceae bacterium]|nr:DUF1559 domain-containing protein [Pirellulaceae bacterium]
MSQLTTATQEFENVSQRLPSGLWYQEIMAFTGSPLFNQVLVDRDFPDEQIEALTCPADHGDSHLAPNGYSNFVANHGVWPLRPELAGPVKFYSDAQTHALRMSDIADGTHSTALFSEVLRGGNGRLRMIWSLEEGPFEADQLDDFAAAAQQLPKDPEKQGFVGHKSTKGRIIARSLASGNPIIYSEGLGRSLYNHGTLPQTPACQNGTISRDSLVPPSSAHKDVHVAFCDGRIESVTRQINLQIWRAYGSTAAND